MGGERDEPDTLEAEAGEIGFGGGDQRAADAGDAGSRLLTITQRT